MHDARVDAIAGLRFEGTWRHYQALALETFEADRLARRRSTHVVAPPGSGKTLLGFEILRRLGAPALVLAPNSAIQAQWARAGEAFGAPPGLVAAAPGAPVACLTYQALARLDDPGAALRGAAEARWAAERAAATGEAPEAVAAEAAAWTGAAAQRRTRELARITASLKRDIARGEHAQGDGARLADLLAPGARERVAALRAGGVRTIVLDECHHLASLWGYVVRAVLGELGGDVHVVGLTATPPDELTTQEAELYAALLGPVDFQVPTPAVVRDGHLAPYQELAWLTEPLAGEQQWLAEHETRFRELVTGLLDVQDEGPLDLGQWVVTRLRHRTRAGEDEAEVPWSDFQRRHPALAAAGVRFLGSAGLPLPPGAPRGEAHRRPPDLADWVVLLEDWVLRCLDGRAEPAAAARREAVAAALRDLGYTLTRTGIRRAASDVDRLLTSSAAKPLALVEVLGAEAEARGTGLRALVLCDAELAGARPDGELRARARPGRGDRPRGGRRAGRRRPHGRPAPAARVRPRASVRGGRRRRAAGGARCGGRRDGGGDPRARRRDERRFEQRTRTVAAQAGAPSRPAMGWPSCAGRASGGRGAGSGSRPRSSRPGATRALVGTRAFLGEGWNAPCVNCLVDLTSAATGVSVRQMRGRSLRLDPADPEKVASNWDVVCVAPRHAQGAADYARFVRKHRHLHAPADDGTLEAGVGHVHPDLSPFAPPPADHFGRIARAMVARAADRDAARERWRIGAPYEGHEIETLVLHPRDGARAGARRAGRAPAGAAPRAARPARARRRRRARVRGRRRRGGPARARRPPGGGRPRRGRARARAAGRGRATRPPRRWTASRAPSATRTWRCGELRPGGGGLARLRAARLGLPALPPARGDAGGGRARHGRARRAARPGRAAALPRLAPDRPAGPVARRRSPGSPRAPAGRSSSRGTPSPTTSAGARTARRRSRPRGSAGSGPCELRFTQRDGPGREALAEAAAQEWSFDTQRRAVWQ